MYAGRSGHRYPAALTTSQLVPRSARYRRAGVGGVLDVLQVKTNFTTVQDALYLILLFTAPLVLIMALLLGWIIARAALRPIGRISRTVRAIGESGDLSRRLNFVGPTDEVGRLANTFDGMMDRLEQAFETQKRFVADASHELRTPLTAIRGYDRALLFSTQTVLAVQPSV